MGIDDTPALGRGFEEDSGAMTAFLSWVEDELAALPPKAERDQDQRRAADTVTNAARLVRRRFIERHAGQVHAELTDGGRAPLRLHDLVDQATELWPGLVPTKAQQERERVLAQADKEGREVDLGIFFWGLLRDVTAGEHLVESMRRPTPQAMVALPAFRATGFVDLGVVTVRRVAGVSEVTLLNLPFLNAEDDIVVAALEVAVDLVLLDDATEVGVLRGGAMTHPRYAGRRVFGAGINLTRLYQGEISLLDFFLSRELGYINKILRGLVTDRDDWLPEPVEKPWIAVVDTFAIGGGAQLLLVFDHVVAERGAYFTLPALREGIIPGAANLRLPGAAGPRLARQMIFRDRRVDAETPEGASLCDEVVDAGELSERTTAAAIALADPAVLANRRMLRRYEEPESRFREYMAWYALEQARLLHSPDLVANLERTWIARHGGGKR
ncbi:enoyl-CoA hydratase/isomerase family protein [Saccharothrix sp. ALI-22-I]|uniref:enoyl-CoA hydratase/isomerase family protein n=1 Tax=Saccharothrix sp. ALI-22-I TaxID=1933778 RepID=UPI001EE71DFD|nr:enoyl-CoA hydratase/isomerase family protein [Saccharothrix sp. ALI-22-I]